MEEKLLNEIKKTNRILAMLLVKDCKFPEKLKNLKNAGFDYKEIAEIIETTPATISVELSKLKKKLKKK